MLTNNFTHTLSLRSFSTKRFSSLQGSISRNKKILLAVSSIIAVTLMAGMVLKNKPSSTSKDKRITIQGPKAETKINRDFSFPIKDEKGRKVTTMVMYLDTAQLRDEIIVKGQKAYPVQGKTFLILDMRIKNDFDKPLEIRARDFFRLVVNGKETDKLAADIHNDPVNIQPLSTKQTRLGFFIKDTDKNLSLFVGELTGKKTKVPILF